MYGGGGHGFPWSFVGHGEGFELGQQCVGHVGVLLQEHLPDWLLLEICL